MVKINDPLEFQQPVPRATRLPSIANVGAGYTNAANINARTAGEGSGFGIIAEGLTDRADEMALAQGRIQKRTDAVARAKAVSAYTEQVTAELLKVSEEGDLSDPETASGFGDYLNNTTRKFLSEHKGSPESKAQLAVTLEKYRSESAGKAASMTIEIQKAAVAEVLEGGMNELFLVLNQDPSKLGEVRDQMRKQLKEYEGALNPIDERQFIISGDSRLVERALDMFIQRGDIDTVERMLRETPGLARLLVPEAQARVFDKMIAFKQAQFEAQNAGVALRVRIAAELGVKPDSDAVTNAIMNSEDYGDKPEDMVKTQNPDGSLTWTKESEAEGQRAPDVKALIDIDIAAAMAKLRGLEESFIREAIVREELIEDGKQAFRTLDSTALMKAAMKSGKFTTGPFAGVRLFMANLASFVGAGPDIIEWTGDAATANTLDAASSRLAIELAQKLSRLTNMSITLVRDSLPALTRTPEGNMIIIEVMEGVANREIQLASMADDMYREWGTLSPKDLPSLWDMLRDLEQSQPVVSDELLARIAEGAATGPNSFKDIFDEVGKMIDDGVDKILGEEDKGYSTTVDDVLSYPPGTPYWYNGKKYRKNLNPADEQDAADTDVGG